MAPGQRGALTDLFQIGKTRVDQLRSEGSVYTARRYGSILSMLCDYESGRALPLNRITPSYLRAYESHLVGTRGNRPSTVASKMRALKALFSIAVRDGLIAGDDNPFRGVAVREPKSTKVKLSLGDIVALTEVDLHRPQLELARDAFLFSFYCAGIRFGDICRLRPSNVRKGRLEWAMGKVDRGHGVMLVPAAEAILERHAESSRVSGFLFPFLVETDLRTPDAERRAIGARNSAVNRALKEIAVRAGVYPDLSFHVGRHTFADYARREGIDIYTISKMLGHTEIAITQRYLKGFDEEAVDAGLERLFGSS